MRLINLGALIIQNEVLKILQSHRAVRVFINCGVKVKGQLYFK